MNNTSQPAPGCPIGGVSKTAPSVDDSEVVDETSENIDWAIGPGSMTWRVLKNPAVFFIGMLRTSMLIPLHPPFAAAAELDTSYLTDPLGRFRRIAIFAYMGVTVVRKMRLKSASTLLKVIR